MICCCLVADVRNALGSWTWSPMSFNIELHNSILFFVAFRGYQKPSLSNSSPTHYTNTGWSNQLRISVFLSQLQRYPRSVLVAPSRRHKQQIQQILVRTVDCPGNAFLQVGVSVSGIVLFILVSIRFVCSRRSCGGTVRHGGLLRRYDGMDPF